MSVRMWVAHWVPLKVPAVGVRTTNRSSLEQQQKCPSGRGERVRIFDILLKPKGPPHWTKFGPKVSGDIFCLHISVWIEMKIHVLSCDRVEIFVSRNATLTLGYYSRRCMRVQSQRYGVVTVVNELFDSHCDGTLITTRSSWILCLLPENGLRPLEWSEPDHDCSSLENLGARTRDEDLGVSGPCSSGVLGLPAEADIVKTFILHNCITKSHTIYKP